LRHQKAGALQREQDLFEIALRDRLAPSDLLNGREAALPMERQIEHRLDRVLALRRDAHLSAIDSERSRVGSAHHDPDLKGSLRRVGPWLSSHASDSKDSLRYARPWLSSHASDLKGSLRHAEPWLSSHASDLKGSLRHAGPWLSSHASDLKGSLRHAGPWLSSHHHARG